VAMIVAGVLEIWASRSNETLQTGDALVLSTEPVTAWRNPGPEEARVLWCILP